MTDAEKVATIERRAELRLLERLLAERERPIPTPPPHHNPHVRNLLADLMRLLEATYEPHNRYRLRSVA